jgi:hypothetical protein
VIVNKYLLKAIKRLDRTLSGPANNFSEQFLYSHREILVAYSGISANLALKGSIEHGWSPFGPSLGVPKRPGKRYLHLAWSEANKNRFGHRYPKNVVPVGSPFLYLSKLCEDNDMKPSTSNRKYLFIPTHGTETDSPTINKIIKSYSSIYDPEASSVQLYWTEFINEDIRNTYIQAGFQVMTAGFSGISATEGLGVAVRERAMSNIGSRHLFLLRVLQNLNSHNKIIFGGFGTSTLYAGYMQKQVELLPNWDEIEYVRFDKGISNLNNQDYDNFVKTDILPLYFNQNHIANSSFKDFCDSELGVNNMLSKIQLAELIKENSFDIKSNYTVENLLSNCR